MLFAATYSTAGLDSFSAGFSVESEAIFLTIDTHPCLKTIVSVVFHKRDQVAWPQWSPFVDTDC